MRLLVVEDDPSISGPLRTGLVREGFEVELAATGRAALDAAPVDLVLLDLGLPDLDGQAVCRELRARSAVPIVVVSARGEEIDRVTLLELGADDYVVKPFGFRELVARIRAVLRRSSSVDDGAQSDTIAVGDLVIDRRTRAVVFGGKPVELARREFDLLTYLAADAGAVLTRDQIMADVWDENWWGPTKTLDVHVASLRKKLAPGLIDTVRGVGFVMPVDQPQG